MDLNRTSEERRALIRTLPLTNGNYGGILQAYALQLVIKRLGLPADTDVSARWHSHDRRKRALTAMKRVLFPPKLFLREYQSEINRSLLDFVADRISTVRVFGPLQRPRRKLLRQYGVFITGSDQVWRPLYGDVPSYLFSFLPAGTPLRVSYAASFGTDDLTEYSLELRSSTRRAATQLAAVSVRELSGVTLARELWGVHAEQHVDPTMLLEADDYLDLVRSCNALQPSPENHGLVTYVLDESDATSRLVLAMSSLLGVDPTPLSRPRPRRVSDYRTSPSKYAKIPVEEWLSHVSSARLLVTDSFHGCVFAIIFNTPFLVVPNVKRGVARFESLLSCFDLLDRLILADWGDDDLSRVAHSEIDWVAVNAVLKSERRRGIDYLRSMLVPVEQ